MRSKNFSILLILSICLIPITFFGINEYHTGQQLNVLAISGMNLRDAPKGNVLQKIPYGSRIKTLQAKSTTNPETIEGIQGNWVKVEYNGATGFVFDGFLSTLPAPELNSESLYKYASVNFRSISTRLPVAFLYYGDGMEEKTTQIFSNSRDTIVYLSESYHEGFKETVSIPNISMEEAYLIIRACFSKLYAETLSDLTNGDFPSDNYQPKALKGYLLNGNEFHTEESGEEYDYYFCPLGFGCAYEVSIRQHNNRVFIISGGGC